MSAFATPLQMPRCRWTLYTSHNHHLKYHDKIPAIAMPKPSPRPDQKEMPTFPLDEAPAPVNTCPTYVALLLVNVAKAELVVFVLVEPASVPPIPLQIILPTLACSDVVAVGGELTLLVTVVFASVMVELPTTKNSLLGARLTGVSRIVTAELPGVRVVPAMTIGLDGRITTGRL
jgi:hypothetical protein